MSDTHESLEINRMVVRDPMEGSDPMDGFEQFEQSAGLSRQSVWKGMAELTYRQRRFIEGVQQGRSYARAAREAGYSESVANVAGQKLARHPAIQAQLTCNQAIEELAQRVKPYEEILLQLEEIDDDARDMIKSIIRSLAEKNFIQARLSAWCLEERCKQTRP